MSSLYLFTWLCTGPTVPINATSWEHNSTFYTMYKAQQSAVTWIVWARTCTAAAEMLWSPGSSSDITVWLPYQNVSPKVCTTVIYMYIYFSAVRSILSLYIFRSEHNGFYINYYSGLWGLLWISSQVWFSSSGECCISGST